MNYIIVNSVCCCLQCCCKQIFETLQKILGRASFVKIMYFVIYAAFFLILLGSFIFLRDWSFFMDKIAQGINCSNSQDFDCITVSLIYRIVTSISIFIVFLLIILSLCTNRISHILNESLFFSKFVIITIIFIILLQFGNSMYQHLSVVYEYIAYLFLICQGIIIIDVGYLWGIKWAEKYSQQNGQKYGLFLILFTVIMFILALGMNIYGYILVSNQHGHMRTLNAISQCSNFPNILNTIFIVLCIGIQLLNYNKQNSLLTTSFMCIYISYWCFSAIYSSNKCNLNQDLFTSSDQHDFKHYSKTDFYYAGTIISVFWLLLSTFGSIFGSTNKMQESNSSLVQYIQMEQSYKETSKNGINQKDQNNLQHSEGQNKINWIIWHFFMFTMIIYLSMVLTDWGSGNLITHKYSLNDNAYISKIFMACFSFAVYIWTLLAPRLFPSRNFYFV